MVKLLLDHGLDPAVRFRLTGGTAREFAENQKNGKIDKFYKKNCSIILMINNFSSFPRAHGSLDWRSIIEAAAQKYVYVVFLAISNNFIFGTETMLFFDSQIYGYE